MQLDTSCRPRMHPHQKLNAWGKLCTQWLNDSFVLIGTFTGWGQSARACLGSAPTWCHQDWRLVLNQPWQKGMKRRKSKSVPNKDLASHVVMLFYGTDFDPSLSSIFILRKLLVCWCATSWIWLLHQCWHAIFDALFFNLIASPGVTSSICFLFSQLQRMHCCCSAAFAELGYGYPLSLITYACAAGNEIAQMGRQRPRNAKQGNMDGRFSCGNGSSLHARPQRKEPPGGKECSIQSTACCLDDSNGRRYPKAGEILQTAMVFERGCFLATERITPVIPPSIANSLGTKEYFMDIYNIIQIHDDPFNSNMHIGWKGRESEEKSMNHETNKYIQYIEIHVHFTCGFSQVAAVLQKGSGHFQLAHQTTRIDDLATMTQGSSMFIHTATLNKGYVSSKPPPAARKHLGSLEIFLW